MSFLKSLTNGWFTVRQALALWISMQVAFGNTNTFWSHILVFTITYFVVTFLVKE